MSKTYSKLSRAAIRRLVAGESITEHGIRFVRADNGDGVYEVNIMVDGQRIHRVVGRESEGTTRTQAEDFIAKVRMDARHDRLALPKGRKVAMSFKDAATKYIARLTEAGARDVKKKQARLDLHLIPFFGAMPLSRITGFDIDRYKKARLGQAPKQRPGGKGDVRESAVESKVKPATVNRELAVLSHLFNQGIEWGWLDRRPAKIKRCAEGQGRIVYLTADQARALEQAALDDGNAQLHVFVVLGLQTAMRMSEILSIRSKLVDLDRRVIHLPKAKSGAREQPITEYAAEVVGRYMVAMDVESEWLFPSRTSRVGHTTTIRRAFRRAVVAAGLDATQVVRHTLRHTAITHLVQEGVDLPTVKRISGHKTLAMVERYAHQNGAHIAAAMAKLDRRFRKEAA